MAIFHQVIVGRQGAIGCLVCLLLALAAGAVQASPVWVAVKQSTIRKDPSFLSPVLAKVSYQEELESLREQAEWWQVRSGRTAGWIHHSALSKSLKLNAGQSAGGSLGDALSFLGGSRPASSNAGRGARPDDITLAGKGFNKDVEDQYRGSGGNLNYEAVDLMESRSIDAFSPDSFAAEGGLKVAGAGKDSAPDKDAASAKGIGLPNPLNLFR